MLFILHFMSALVIVTWVFALPLARGILSSLLGCD